MVERKGRKLFTLRHPPYPHRTKLLWGISDWTDLNYVDLNISGFGY